MTDKQLAGVSRLMKIISLLAGCLVFATQHVYAVKTGLYYFIPVPAARLVIQDNGTVSELERDTTGAVQMIVINEDRIDISDNRAIDSKQVNILIVLNGPVPWRPATRHRISHNDDKYFSRFILKKPLVKSEVPIGIGICRHFSIPRWRD